MKTCMNCSRYIACDNKRKGFEFVCDKHKRIQADDLFFSKAEPEKPVAVTADLANTSEFNIEHLVNAALSDSSATPVDVKINDSHIPKAKNFFEFSTGEEFLNIKPYVEQMCIATVLLSEFCTRCSRLDWLFETHKVDDPLSKFERRVALLEHGVCPYCGATKSELVNANEVKFYQELAVAAGQRCVAADTQVLTTQGLKEVGDLCADLPYGYSDFEVDLWNGERFERTSRAFRAPPEPLLLVTLANGAALTGTREHPLMTDEHWRPLGALRPGDRVMTATPDFLYSYSPVLAIEQVAPQDTFDFVLPETHRFWTNCMISHNSGKSALVAMISAYHVHRVLKLQKPNEVYGLLQSNVLQLTFVALTYAQAFDTLFTALHAYLTTAPWFCTYNSFMLEQSSRYGEELIKLNDTVVTYRHRSLMCYASGPDKRTLRGRCMVGSTLVSTDRGFLMLKELVQEAGQHPAALVIDSPSGRCAVTHTYKAASKTLLATTRNGFTVQGTPEHPMLVLTPALDWEWREMRDLQAGDFVVSRVPDNDPLYGGAQLALPDIERLVDLAVRDDHMPLAIRAADRYALNAFTSLLVRRLARVHPGGATLHLGLRLGRQLHVHLFHYYGFLGRLSVVPSGTIIDYRGRDYAGLAQYFRFGPASLPFAYDPDHRALPYVRERLRARLSKAQTPAMLRLRWLAGDPVADYPVSEVPRSEYEQLYAERWNEMLPELDDPALARFLGQRAHYEEVVSVAAVKERLWVYDVTVPDGHAFTANCLTSHNTRVLSALDELGWMDNDADSKKVKMNANEIYVALERSLLTVRAAANKLVKKGFSDIPGGLFLNISSPSSVRDKIMELVRKSQNSNKIYGLVKPTWEMNPTVSFADLEEEFRKDEVTAWRDYGARPPLSSNAFIQSTDAVEKALTSKKNGAMVDYATKNYGDESYRYGKIVNIKRVTKKSILALDAGLTQNSFSCVSGYMEGADFVVSTAIEVIPHPGAPVNFTLVYKNIISKIVEYQNVVLVVADRWNSVKFLSDLREDLGVATEQYSLRYQDFWLIRDMLFSNNILLPEPTQSVKECVTYNLDDYPLCYENKPIDHLILQLLTVRDTGNAITKGDGGLTDDLFRAMTLAVHRRLNEKAADLFEEDAGDDSASTDPQQFLIVARQIPALANLGHRPRTISAGGKPIAVAKRSRQ